MTLQFKVPSIGGAGAPSHWKDRRDLNCPSTQGSDTLRVGTLSNGRLRLVDNQNGGKTTPMSTVSLSADMLRCNALTPTGTLAAYVSFDNMVSRRSPDILCIVFEHPSGSDLGRVTRIPPCKHPITNFTNLSPSSHPPSISPSLYNLVVGILGKR